MSLSIASIIASFIIAIGGIIASVICVSLPRQRKSKIIKLQKELLDTYKGILQLKKLEESLEQRSGISKQKAREGVEIPHEFEPARLKEKIKQLEKQLS